MAFKVVLLPILYLRCVVWPKRPGILGTHGSVNLLDGRCVVSMKMEKVGKFTTCLALV